MNARRGALIASLAALALGLSACGGGDGGDNGSAGSGDGGEPIKVGIIADLTGATGDVGKPYNEGMLAYIDYRNANGGVDGRQIQATSNDYAYEVPKAEQLYKQYVNDGVVAVQGWGTGDTEALHTKVAQDELPFMSGSFAESLTDPAEAPYNFVSAPTYSDQMRIALNWINEDSGGDAEVAVFHHDSPFGLAPVADGEAWVSEKGYGLGYQAYAMPAGQQNYVGLLSQAQSQGAKYIVIQNVASPAAQVAKDIKAQGLDMKIVCLNWCANELFITTAGADVAEGHMGVQPFAPIAAEKPGHEEMVSYLEDKGQDPATKGTSWVQGWMVMHVMAEGMAKAAEDGEVDGPSIKEALETMGGIDTGGVIGDGTVEFSAESHRGSTSAGVYTMEGGKMVEVEAGATP
ncbi:ABC transporter substrate-binding protein [Ornithinimicrobium tianjinense]|uniref:Branched-chain amino acid ABC transporter substrate-binding protein n=1 Tax=Ornithinimicrobium tianjinense TaxID=1195761 RepID=A0A917BV28_9MICO|nr:ABC transporter substrate-binding protein [Ornithinimicrobium tianjinense]GGF58487.1 branched-chain amino acid ABC transporter substrate-binding protein [Ornithinimicrobium tianjinense]